MGIEARKIIVITCDEPGCDAAFSRETEISGVTAIMAAASVDGWTKKHRPPYRVLCPIHASGAGMMPDSIPGLQNAGDNQPGCQAGVSDGGAGAGLESSSPLADTTVDAPSRRGVGEFNSPTSPRDEASNA